MGYESPFEGLRVVDLSQGIAGPYCGMLLAQYGADVVKIEPPEGDWARHLGKPFGEHTPFSVAGNLGKRSVVMDLKNDADKARLWTLIDDADVFIEGFRPGVIERLGFGYDTVFARNRRILYVSISGFGQTGPLAKKPAMDPVLQAFTGYMAANPDKEGTPQRAGPIIVDMSTALYAYQAVSTALFARRDQEVGRHLEISLMEAAANLQCVRMMQTYLLGAQPPSATAPAGAFACKEGHLFIVVFRQTDFEKLCEILDLPSLAANPAYGSPQDRFLHMDEINRTVAAEFLKDTAAAWSEKLTSAGLQNEQILDYVDFLDHPHVKETETVSWLTQTGFDGPVPMPNVPGAAKLRDGDRRAHSPGLGEHTGEVFPDAD